MHVIRHASAERYEPDPNWKRASLCAQPDISIEHFIKPAKHASPLHAHPNTQVLVVLEGQITVTTDSDEQTLEAGDAVYLPPNETHIVSNPQDTPSVGLDIFVPGRSFDFWLRRK